MAGSLTSTCPECGTAIQSTWRWCLACGYDPDGLRPAAGDANAVADRASATATAVRTRPERHERRRAIAPASGSDPSARNGVWFYVGVVVVSLVLAGIVYTVRSRSNTTEAPPSGAAGTVAPAEPTWLVFAPPNAGFKVELPGKVATQPAQKATMAGVPTTVHAFTSVTGLTTIGVTYADLGAAATSTEPDVLLGDLLKEAAETLGGSVQSSQSLQDHGRPALDYTIDIRGTGKNQGRIILADTRVYTLNVIGPAPRQGDVDHVVSSFSIT